MKYVAVSAIWLGMSGALAAMAHYGALTGKDAAFAVLFGGVMAILAVVVCALK